MSKITLKVELSVTIDTDLDNPLDIMNNIDLTASGNDVVEVCDTEVDNFYIEASK